VRKGTALRTTYDLTSPLATVAAAPAARFPTSAYDAASGFYDDYVSELGRAARSVDPAQLERAAAMLLQAYTTGGAVFACGNGGSASIANHLQCDHTKGIGNGTDLLARVVSLSSNVEVLTAVANDLGYEEVFTHQLRSQARPGDVLFAISSSGSSPNIVSALRWARGHGMGTISLTGFDGGPARQESHVALHVDCYNYGVVEDLHQAVMHALAQYLRQSRLPGDQVASTQF